jgi:hypothetical protein
MTITVMETVPRSRVRTWLGPLRISVAWVTRLVELLLRIAEGQGKAFDQARTMIGVSNLALLLANEAFKTENTIIKNRNSCAFRNLEGRSNEGSAFLVKLSIRMPLFKDSMDDKEEFEGVEKAVKRLTILALILGVLHVLGQLFLAQR